MNFIISILLSGSPLGGDCMFKILEKRKKHDDIKLKKIKDEMDYCYRKFSEENDKRMKDLNNQRKLNNKNKQQSSLWANAIKNSEF